MRTVHIIIRDDEMDKITDGEVTYKQIEEMNENFGIDAISVLISRLNEELDKQTKI